MTTTLNHQPGKAGAAAYTKPVLAFYDLSALQINCRFIWKCSPPVLLAHYNEYVTGNHIDVGVGTGYFLSHCRFPGPTPRLALMDLNANSLDVTAKRVAHYNPRLYQHDVLTPISFDEERFDSLGMMNLLHCLPGNMASKAAVFDHIKVLLNPGAVLFGSTILGSGVQHSSLGTRILHYCNAKGYLSILDDDAGGLEKSLKSHFDESTVKIQGRMALFSARY